MRSGFRGAALLAILLAASCSDGAGQGDDKANGSITESTVPAPPSDLYQPPEPMTAAPPGTPIWAERVPDLPLNPPATVWRILYHSRSRDSRDVAVSGFAVVPAAATKGARAVYAWAHGTVGLGDQCAPSHDIRENLPPYGGQQIERGAVLVATDYAGLGTPGVHTGGDALAEAHAVLDSIRAVATLPNVGTLGDVVIAGHSQGGRAALFAAEAASSYAPELDLVGVVALAPGVELPALVDHLSTSPSRGLVLIGAVSLRAAYPDLDVSTVFTPAAIADIPRVESECVDATIARYGSIAVADLISHSPKGVPALQRLLEQNSPGTNAPSVPVFIGHSDADQQVPIALTGVLHAKYCKLGVAVTRRVYAREDHDATVDAAADDAMAFITDRLGHRVPTTTCG